MHYLLNENELLHSRFFIFFLIFTNQTKFEAKKEKEFHPHKVDKWLSGSNLKNFHKIDEKSKQYEDSKSQASDFQNHEVLLHQFLEESHPYLTENHKLYKKYPDLTKSNRDSRRAQN